jgi:hypothetical protein
MERVVEQQLAKETGTINWRVVDAGQAPSAVVQQARGILEQHAASAGTTA